MLATNQANKLQDQLTLERTNEAYYRSLAAAADVVNRPGAKKYFTNNAQDEQIHAQLVEEYLIARGEQPIYAALPMIPAINGNDYGGMFRLALAREQATTQALQEICTECDAQTLAFLVGSSQLLEEQTRSERELVDHLLKIGRLGEDGLEVFDASLK